MHIMYVADRTALFRIYRSLIRSKCNYGSTIYTKDNQSNYCEYCAKYRSSNSYWSLSQRTPINILHPQVLEWPLKIRQMYLPSNFSIERNSSDFTPPSVLSSISILNSPHATSMKFSNMLSVSNRNKPHTYSKFLMQKRTDMGK